MSERRVNIDELADSVMEELKQYAETTTDGVKDAVRKAANTVKKEINVSAPVKTGRYAKSWSTKATRETSCALEITVYSPKRYMLTHLLEYGHAKRGGGRVRGNPHIAPAEERGEKQLTEEIERILKS